MSFVHGDQSPYKSVWLSRSKILSSCGIGGRSLRGMLEILSIAIELDRKYLLLHPAKLPQIRCDFLPQSQDQIRGQLLTTRGQMVHIWTSCTLPHLLSIIGEKAYPSPRPFIIITPTTTTPPLIHLLHTTTPNTTQHQHQQQQQQPQDKTTN